MLHFVVCCAGGFSSSFMSNKVEKEIRERNLEEEVSITFLAFTLFKKRYQEFDFAFLCPHLLHDAKRFSSEVQLPLPIYVLPSQMYGTMYLDDLLEDAQDLLELYKDNVCNPVHFPEEPYLVIDRNRSHRKWIQFQAKLQAKK